MPAIQPLSVTTYLTLLALYHGPLHGYGIIKEIEKVSEGRYIIAPGTLYGVLKNLEKQGWIETIAIEKEKRKKKTYRMTEKGKNVLEQEYIRYTQIVHLSSLIIQEGPVHGEKT